MHLLLFQLSGPQPVLLAKNEQGGAMQVESMVHIAPEPETVSEAPPRSVPAVVSVKSVARPVAEPVPAVAVIHTAVPAIEPVAEPMVEQGAVERAVVLVTEAVAEAVIDRPADMPNHPSANASATPAVQPVPGDVRRMIMTRIGYPRMARRRGWEGIAMFRLDVREQKLARLDLAASTGHDLLDAAAMRGIRAVERLPLANGLYDLPVEFRLQ